MKFNTIRKVTSGGVVTTFAGTPGLAGTTDGNWQRRFVQQSVRHRGQRHPHLCRRYDEPHHPAGDTRGRRHHAGGHAHPDWQQQRHGHCRAILLTRTPRARPERQCLHCRYLLNQTIRVMTPRHRDHAGGTGVVGTRQRRQGQQHHRTGTAASFNYPTACGGRQRQCLYRRFRQQHDPQGDGVVTTFAGGANHGTDGFFNNGIAGPTAHFNNPMGIAIDSSGNALRGGHTANDMIRKIAPPTSANSVLTVSRSSIALQTPRWDRFMPCWTAATSAPGSSTPALLPPTATAISTSTTHATRSTARSSSTQVVSTLGGTGGVIGSADGVDHRGAVQ